MKNALEQVCEEAQVSNVRFVELNAHVHLDVRGWPEEKLAKYVRRYRRLVDLELVGYEPADYDRELRIVIRVPKNAPAFICW